MRNTLVIVHVTLFLLMPSIGMILGASSMAAGLVFATLYAIILILVAGIRKNELIYFKKPLLFAAILSVAVLFSLIISGFKYYSVDYSRGITSLFLLLVIIVLGVPLVSIYLSKIQTEEFSRILYGVFYMLIAMGFVASLGYSPFYDKSKAVVVFSEPSHYALLLFPFLLYSVLFASNKLRIFYILCALFLALSLQSLTLVIMIMIVLFMFLPRRFAIPSILMLLFVGSIFLDTAYYTSRINFSSENNNLSSIVYASGWERAYLSVKENFPFGIGFQQMGIIGPTGSYMEYLDELNAANLNSLDGGSTAPKLIAEFGMLGVLCVCFYLVYFFRLLKWLSVIALKRPVVQDHYQIFLLCCYIAYSADLFFRGAGYFSILMFLFLLCLSSITNWIDKSSYNKRLR